MIMPLIYLSYRTAARLLEMSQIEVTLLVRGGFLSGRRNAVQLVKNAWKSPKYIDMLKRSSFCVGGW